jgi:hypothetical protein
MWDQFVFNLMVPAQDYKPPMPKDIPEDLRVTFLRNAPNPYGVLRSKGTSQIQVFK